jgi:hypothetical protein|tara:strand:+ start:191 stop:1075 length:885 start_codon:yes stop_codon:yes gene_type:complete
MTVETATSISMLSATLPLATGPISEGDDHLRLIKSVLQAQFTSLGTSAVTATATELNLIDGYTGTTAELNYLDLTTLGTSEDSKVVTQDASGDIVIGSTAGDQTMDIACHDLVDGGLKLAGTLVTASATELNLIDGYTGTTAELNTLDVTTQGTAEASKAVTSDASLVTNFADGVVQRPEMKDYSETKTALSAAASVTIDITNGNVFTITPDQDTEFAFTNPSPTGKSCAFTLIWTQDASDRTITWPTTVDWAGGSTPDVTSGSGKIDIYTFFTIDEGTIWYGFQAGADMLTPS